ncbi:hypothetical protein [Burkholderia sp. RF2-non_BP3]|uniref:hypothetical protein n=1 Tax=Burkholderia sp. RF2-non_BP3 TaxID=1637844 RepID=UPI00075E571E|nr:hypothetical protein [Burkholderia sp. RF2-non_BP3]KUY52384.1 hypothetical protein WS45_25025 [Burkholderia sp. RF2-non_BP3]
MATVNSIATGDAVLQRLEKLISEKSALAWKMHNTLAFMAQALPEDEPTGLPVQNALDDMRRDMEQLAVSLQDLVHHARHA